MLIDFHTHVYPDTLAEKAITRLCSKGGKFALTNGTKADIKEKMKARSITHFVVQHIATKPLSAHKVNDFAFAIQDEMLISFASVYPNDDNCLEEIERIKAMGFKGVKLHPYFQDFELLSDKAMDVFNKLCELDIAVLIHTGREPFFPERILSRPSEIAFIKKSFPSLKIIAAHLGGMYMYEESLKHIVGSDIYIDTSMSYVRCTDKNIYEKIIKGHNPDRILFASDCPWSDPAHELSNLKSLGLSSDIMEKITYKNAAKLLGLAYGEK